MESIPGLVGIQDGGTCQKEPHNSIDITKMDALHLSLKKMTRKRCYIQMFMHVL